MPESKCSVCCMLALVLCLCFASVYSKHGHPSWHGNTGSHGDCVDCDCQDYERLQSLRNNSICIDENHVYRGLELLSKKSNFCRTKVINELASVYSGVADTPGNCHCTGHNTLHTYYDYNGEYHRTCYKDKHYLQIFNNFYNNHHSNSPVSCRSHHSMWSQLSQVSHVYGGVHSCQKMLAEHLGELFKDNNPCHCSPVSDHHSETTTEPTTSTTTSTSTSTTTKQTTTKLPAKPTATSIATPTSMATDIITTTQPVSVHWTCGKFSTVESIALQHHLTHEQATQCQVANNHGSDEALVLINCNVPEPNTWKQGINVMQNCHQIPTYTPVATFIGRSYYPSQAESGVFMGCIENGFKLGVQHCNDVPTIDHVIVNSTGLQNADHFFVIN